VHPLLDNPIVLALCAAFVFGLALVLTQFGLRYVSPGHGALVSIPTSGVLLWLLSPFLLDWRGWDPCAAGIFVVVGLLFPAVVTLLTFEANRRMGPSMSGALSNLTPIFAVVPAALFLGEVPRPVQSLGIATIVAGVVTLSIDRRWLGVPWSYWAAALPLGAAAVRGVTHPITKLGLASWPSPFAATLIGYTMSGIVVASVARARGGWPAKYSRAALAWFACVGTCNVLGVLALYAALARGPVILVSPLVATYPLVTLAFSAILFRSARINVPLVAGVALTVAGVVLLVAA
jgi:drug/metabolite transporter (DMT)-like permease